MADPMTKKEVFELAWLAGQITEDQQDGVLADLRQEQPELLEYFAELEDEFPDPRECDAVLGMAITIWLIMRRSPDPPGRVTDEMIAYAMEGYDMERMRLASLEGAARKKATAEAALSHPEPAVLNYVALMLRGETNPPLTVKSYRRAKYVLRVVLDALIAGRGSRNRDSGAGRPAGRAPVGRA